MSRRGFSKNKKRFDAKTLNVEQIAGKIRSSLIEADTIIVDDLDAGQALFNITTPVNFNNQPATNVNIQSGSVNGVNIGQTNPGTGIFTSLASTGTVLLSNNVAFSGNSGNFIWNGTTDILSIPSQINIGSMVINGQTDSMTSVNNLTITAPNLTFNVAGTVTGLPSSSSFNELTVDQLFLNNNAITTTSLPLVLSGFGGVTGLIDMQSPVSIIGGNINGTTIGNSNPAVGTFQNLTYVGLSGTNTVTVPTTQNEAYILRDSTLTNYLTLDTNLGQVVLDVPLQVNGNMNVTGTISGSIAASGITNSGQITLNSTANNIVLLSSNNTTLTSTSGTITLSSQGIGTLGLETTSTNSSIRLNSASVTDNGLEVLCTGGGMNLAVGTPQVGSVALGLNMDLGTGGLDLDSSGGLIVDCTSVTSSTSITHTGAAGVDLTLECLSGSSNLIGGEAVADAVNIQSSNAAGGISMVSGTAGINLSGTGFFSSTTTGTGAGSNITHTGAAGQDLTVSCLNGSTIISSGEAVSDAIQFTASNAAGGISMVSGTSGFSLSGTGFFSSTTTGTGAGSNITHTGAAGQDLTVSCLSGSTIISSGEAVSDAIQLTTSNASGGISVITGSGGWNFPKATVTQLGAITNAVTADSVSGVVTTVNAATASLGVNTFTVNNDRCIATSVVHVNIQNYSGTYTTNGLPTVNVNNISAGAFDIVILNTHNANALNGVLQIAFSVV